MSFCTQRDASQGPWEPARTEPETTSLASWSGTGSTCDDVAEPAELPCLEMRDRSGSFRCGLVPQW